MSNARTDFADVVANCEEKIRSGQSQLVQRIISDLNINKIPREFRKSLANLCRRVGAVTQGLRVLSPVVRQSKSQSGTPPTDAEWAEYAVLLFRSGSVDEALQILSRLDTGLVPESLLYLSFCYFNQWRYEEAVPLLHRYVNLQMSPYQLLVGKVNLAAALIASDQLLEAEGILQSALEIANSQNYRRLQGNCHELLAQIDYFSGNTRNCRFHLNDAEKLLNYFRTVDRFFVKKWTAIIDATEIGSIEPLTALKPDAILLGEWETLRELEHYSVKIRFDASTYRKLIFGTPYQSYRDRLFRDIGKPFDSADYIYGSAKGIVIDFANGTGFSQLGLESSSKCLSALEILTRDLYRPKALGSLFSELYPGEHFDVFSSPGRVHQILRRTRATLRNTGGHAEITESQGAYRLTINGDLGFRLPLDRNPITAYTYDFQRLSQAVMNKAHFTAKEARSVLDMQRTTFQRFCNWAVDAKLMEKIGSGVNTKYRLAS